MRAYDQVNKPQNPIYHNSKCPLSNYPAVAANNTYRVTINGATLLGRRHIRALANRAVALYDCCDNAVRIAAGRI